MSGDALKQDKMVWSSNHFQSKPKTRSNRNSQMGVCKELMRTLVYGPLSGKQLFRWWQTVCLHDGSGDFEGWFEGKQWSHFVDGCWELFLAGEAAGGKAQKGLCLKTEDTGYGHVGEQEPMLQIHHTMCKTKLYQLFFLFVKLAVRRNLWVFPKGDCILK